MRLLLTTDTIGGVWTFNRELAEGLLQKGHAVALISFGGTPSTAQQAWVDSKLNVWGEWFRFEFSDAPLEWMQDNERAFDAGAAQLVELARSFRADLLHSGQFCWGNLIDWLPCVMTAHSDVLSWAAACKPEVLEGSPWLSRYVDLVQHGIDGADMLVFPTTAMQQVFNRYFRVEAPQRVITNGRSFSPPRRASRLQAVSAGRLWDEAKGLSTLNGITSPMPIVLAGEISFNGAAGDRGTLRSAGVLDEPALHELFSESSIYLACSLYEPFGLAPLEAALCGCAVVARDVGSLREVWAEDALFFRSDAELQQLLERLAHDPAALAEARRRSMRRAQTFTAHRMTSAYIDLYRHLLASQVDELHRSSHAA